jgi:hypothetical protein
MGKPYRSWAERRAIINAVIADSNPPPLTSFSLSPNEETYFRSRAQKAVDALAKKTSEFRAYYALPTENPFWYVTGLVLIIVAMAVAGAIYIRLRSQGTPDSYPLLAACATVAIAAIASGVAGWIAHRNAIRQNTINILFTRFSQAPFGEAMHRFHRAFEYDTNIKVTKEWVAKLRASSSADQDENWKAATSVGYLLNYFEFIAAGVIKGDLDHAIVRDNIRGFIISYHDKCEPYIRDANRNNPKIFEHLIKIRTHYREP